MVTPMDRAGFRADVLRRVRRIERRRRRRRGLLSATAVACVFVAVGALVATWRGSSDSTVASTSGEHEGGALVASKVAVGGLHAVSIAARPDGTMWVLGREGSGIHLGLVSASSAWREVARLPADAAATQVVSAISGGAWVTDPPRRRVYFVSAAGNVHETVRATNPSVSGAVGQDQRFWFAEPDADQLVALGEDGSVVEHPVPRGRRPSVVAAAPNGSIAYGAAGGPQLGTVSMQGTVVEFALPSTSARVVALTTGPGPALWFLSRAGDDVRFGRVAANGRLEDEGDLGGEVPSALDLGPDGQLWFSTRREASVSERSFSGVSRRPVNVRLQVDDWAVAPDGVLWAVDRDTGAVFQLTPR
jgi:streptogramin lyase